MLLKVNLDGNLALARMWVGAKRLRECHVECCGSLLIWSYRPLERLSPPSPCHAALSKVLSLGRREETGYLAAAGRRDQA